MQPLLNLIKNSIEKLYKIDSGIKDMSALLISEQTHEDLESGLLGQVKFDDDAKIYYEIDGSDINVALYFSPDFKERYQQHNPLRIMSGESLTVFRTIIEEVDHCVMLGYSSEQGKPFSKLELELQANIDKYIMMMNWIQKHEQVKPTDATKRKQRKETKDFIFGERFDEEDPDVQYRYEKARVLGKAFVEFYEQLPKAETKFKILRDFYRESPLDKLHFITHHCQF